MPLITGTFATAIVTIIVLANLGQLGQLHPYVGWLYDWPGGDKLAHFLLIGTLAGLVELADSGGRLRVFGWTMPRGSLGVTVVVVLEEASQALIATRSCSLADLAADLLGIIVLGGCGRYLAHRQRTFHPH